MHSDSGSGTLSRRDEGGPTQGEFPGRPCVGPAKPSAQRQDESKPSELSCKNPAVHRREYFQASPPSGLAALTPRAETSPIDCQFDDQDVADDST